MYVVGLSCKYTLLATRMVQLAIHPPSPFLQTAGEPSVSWKRWLAAFDQYVVAAGIVDEGRVSRDCVRCSCIALVSKAREL